MRTEHTHIQKIRVAQYISIRTEHTKKINSSTVHPKVEQNTPTQRELKQ